MGIDGCASGGLVHWSSNFQPTGQCEQAPRMNRSGRKPDYKEGVLFKIKVDLKARYLEVLVLPPEKMWILNQRDSSQPERFFSNREIVLNQRNCSQPKRLFCWLPKGSKNTWARPRRQKKSNQLSRGAQEINEPVYSSLITCFMQSYDNCVLGGGESWNCRGLRSF